MPSARCLAVSAIAAAALAAPSIGLTADAADWQEASRSKVASSPRISAYDIGSLASEFLQSKARLRVLDDEEKAAPDCNMRRFIKVDVVGEPTVSLVENGIDERKWMERWTLDRCGTLAFYWVYFTEVGRGGAYLSILAAETR